MMRNRSWLAGLASKIFPRRFAAARRASRRRPTHSLRSFSDAPLATETLEPRHLLTVSVGDLGFDEPLEPVAAQMDTSGMWQTIFDPALVSGRGSSDSVSYLSLSDYASFTLDQSVLDLRIDAAPAEAARGAGAVITLPTPEGEFQQFAFWDSPIMAPELAAQFPEIQTFVAQGIDDPAATARLDWTPQGFHAQVLSPDGAYYVDPFYHLQPDGPYVSYFLTDYLSDDEHAFVCLTEDVEVSNSNLLTASHEADHHTLDADHGALVSDCHDCQITIHETEEAASSGDSLTLLSVDSSAPYQYGSQLRTYDIAVATTGEYTELQGGTISLGLAAVATTINRLNLVYETDVSVRLNLIAENNLLIFTDGSIDPYTNNDLNAQLSENQWLLDDAVTNGFISEYDIGHVFSTASGGLARLASVGVPGDKAQGASGVHPANPWMSPTFIALAGHEIGHQFGAHHTFNAPSDNRTYYTAYEPGSGSTLMSYAGALGAEDLQSSMDSYYHAISILEILNTINTGYGNAAATITNTGNNVPTVSAGPDYSIPAATPFYLDASGSDADAGDTLTYSWEQYQLGDAQSVYAGDNGSSPLFRSWSPTTDAYRYFPRWGDVVDGSTVVGETLPTTTRDLDFVVTARDNRAGGGGTATDYMTVTVYDTGSAFAVTSPNSSVSWPANSTQTVSWNVAGTNAGSINASTIDVLLLTDSGYHTLASATANDGSHQITVPDAITDFARIHIQPSNNIFYDISDANFSIVAGSSNSAPIITSPGSQSDAEGDSVSLQLSASDPDGDALTWNASGLPSGLSINTTTGLITGTLGYDESGSYSVSVSATDGELSDSQSFTWTIANTNRAPAVTNPGNQSDAEGEAVSLQMTGSDPDGQTLTWNASGLPSGLSIDSDTGLITGTLGYDASGSHAATVTVSDGSLSASTSFTWAVTNTNRSPAITNPGNQSDAEGEAISLQMSGSDPDGQTLTWNASGLPSGLSIDSDTGLITGTLGFDASGSHAATVTVSDGSLSASTSFAWTVTNTNRSPAITNPGNQSDAEGEAVSLQMSGSDPDGQSLIWNASGLPSGLSIDSDTGLITGTLGYDASGSHAATVTVSDGSLSASTSFTWAVTNTNRSPAITNPGNQSDAEGEAVSLQMSGSDPDGQSLIWNASGLPSGLSIDSDTGLITGTLGYDASGSHAATVTVSDGSLSASTSFAWTVSDTNRAPVVSSPGNQSDAEGDSVSLQMTGSDPDGQTLTWNASGLPSGLSIDSDTGLITGTLGYDASGSHAATVTVSDGSLSASTSFTWAVTNTNRSPAITNPGNQSDAEGEAISLQMSGSDPDGQSLTWDASGLPSGLSINTTTGLITGTLDYDEAGSYSAQVSATDGELSDTALFTWTIANTNRAPVVSSPGNRTDAEGEAISLQMSGSDPDGQSLTWDASGLPSGLSIITTTGLITGTLGFDASGSHAATVTVSDGSLSASTSFAWTVSDTNLSEIPVITLLGETPYVVEAISSGSYSDPGATAWDAEDGNISGAVEVSGQVVDLSVPDTYVIDYNVEDSEGNQATTVSRTVIVQDSTAPQITLAGSAEMFIEAGFPYTDAGATVSDSLDGDISGSLVVSGDVVDVGTTGSYTVLYNAQDAAGNAADQVTRTVTVQDTLRPVIAMSYGGEVLQVSDQSDTGLGGEVNAPSGVPSETGLGAVGDAGRLSTPIIRSTDFTQPDGSPVESRQEWLARSPAGEVSSVPVGAAWDHGDSSIVPGSTIVIIDRDGTPLDETVGAVDFDTRSTYLFEYDAVDDSGNYAEQVVFALILDDQAAPVISLNSDMSETVEAASDWTLAAATASDNIDGDLTANIIYSVENISNGATLGTDLTHAEAAALLDTMQVGQFVVTMQVSDAAGIYGNNSANNTSYAQKGVLVQDTLAPVITLTGDAVVNVNVDPSGTYSDAGATAADSLDGDLTGSVAVGGDVVDLSQAGTYTLTYNVSDNAGNAAEQVTRTVNVVAVGSSTVSIAATQQGSEADNSDTIFTLTRTGDTAGELTVNLVLQGTAVPDVDYTAPAGLGVNNTLAVTFAHGSGTATVNLPTLSDAVVDPYNSIIAILQPGSYDVQTGGDRATAYITAEGVAIYPEANTYNAFHNVRYAGGNAEHHNDYAFAALRSDGSIVTWGGADDGGNGGLSQSGNAAPKDSGYTQIFESSHGFAAMKADGSIASWGREDYVGAGAPTDNGYVKIVSAGGSFTAMKSDGSIVCWGYLDQTRNAPTSGAFVDVVATESAYAALAADGSITTWGYQQQHGTGAFAPSDSGYVKIYSSNHCFAAMKADGSITTWGYGNEDFANSPDDNGYIYIFAASSTFTAIKPDGSLTSWGLWDHGGTRTPSGTGFKQVVSNNGTFAALKEDGSIHAWGQEEGGDASQVDPPDTSETGFLQIFPAAHAFAALKADGTITTWGEANYGGENAPSDPGYVHVVGNDAAFAALKADGSITTWGHADYGGSGAPTGAGYTRIIGNQHAFTALHEDGSLTSWGDTEDGGGDAPTGNQFVALADLLVDDRLESFTPLTQSPQVSINATQHGSEADNSASVFTLTRTGDTSEELSVNLILQGTALPTTDYTAPAGLGANNTLTVTFAADSDTATVSLPALSDAVIDPYESIVAIVQSGEDYVALAGSDRAAVVVSAEGVSTKLNSYFGEYYKFNHVAHGWNESGNTGAFALLKSDGSISTWGNLNKGGAGAPEDNGYVQIFASDSSFSALKTDGSISSWGEADSIESGPPSGTGYTNVAATYKAYAALDASGAISTWGSSEAGGTGGPSDTGYVKIIAGYSAFTAMKADGSLTSWGAVNPVGDGAPAGSGFTDVSAGNNCFAALSADGTIHTWGLSAQGGSGGPTEAGYVKIVSNGEAFAALHRDGYVSSWGSTTYGGHGFSDHKYYVDIFATEGAFAAITSDGEISAWGSGGYGGGGSGGSAAPSGSGYTQVVSNGWAFAAIDSAGSVTSWGSTGQGGSGAPTDDGYVKITVSNRAFAALKDDGTISVWGDGSYGGTGAPTDGGYVDVIGNESAFMALKNDGSVTAWGNEDNGGSGAPTDSGYVAFANPLTDDVLAPVIPPTLDRFDDAHQLQLGQDIDGLLAGDLTGYSVSISRSGDTLAVGSMQINNGGTGYVTLYRYDDRNATWVQRGSVISGDNANDSFGFDVELSADGNRVVIGAPDVGHVVGGNSGNGLARIYEFSELADDWVQLGADIDGPVFEGESGSGVAFSPDGSTVAIGAPYANGNAGQTSVYRWDGSSWNSLGSAIDGAGYSGGGVSLSETGDAVAIGMRGVAITRVYTYDAVSDSWSQQAGDIESINYVGDETGRSVSLSSDGTIVAVGSPYHQPDDSGDSPIYAAGLARVYQFNSSSAQWKQLGQNLLGTATDENLGWSLSLSASGNTLAVGARTSNAGGTRSGAAFVYRYEATEDAWYQVGSVLAGEVAQDYAGSAIALSGDGMRLVVGAENNDAGGNQSGSVRVYALGQFGIAENASTQTIPLSGITAGFNESQVLQVTATSDNVGLIPDPAVDYTSPNATGSLLLTPVAGQYGSAKITVTITDGGADDDLATSGDNSTTTRTFDVVVVAAENAAPTDVSLANTVTSLPEDTDTSARVKVADIVITDDGVGDNAISLSGADAASFEVDGTELFLAAGTVLDYETKTSYAVTVSVEDSSVSGSTPVTVDYTLSITDTSEVVISTVNFIHEISLDDIHQSSAPDAFDVAVGDLNSDGYPDVMFGDDVSQDNAAGNRVYLHSGSTDFYGYQTKIINQTDQILPGTKNVALGDFDADGDLDGVSGSHLYINDGTAFFTVIDAPGDITDTDSIVVGDIDGDSDLDILVSDTSGTVNEIHIWINDGSGNFTTSGATLGGRNSRDLEIGDLDGDGDLDLFVANAGATTQDAIYLNDGSGTFTESQLMTNGDSDGAVLGDFDGDTDLDIFIAVAGSGANKVWLNDGSGTFSDSGQSLGSRDSRDAAAGDVDLDGDLDIMVANENGQANTFWANDGSGTFTLEVELSNYTANSQALAFVDLNNDGVLDVIAADRDANDAVYRSYRPALTGLLHTLYHPDPSANDEFGWAVAVDGNRILVGTPEYDNGIYSNAGQVTLFDASTGAVLQTFDNPSPVEETDIFGESLAIDGDHVVIGSLLDDTQGQRVGQAYLFSASSGNLIHTFNDPTVTDLDLFGSSVAVSGDLVAVGAAGDDTDGENMGQVHLFDATTGSLLRTISDPVPGSQTSFNYFGGCLSLDGTNLLVGAAGKKIDDVILGQAYLFDASTGNLLHTFTDPSDTEDSYYGTNGNSFGWSVAIEGNHAVIADEMQRFYVENQGWKNIGEAHLFDVSTGSHVHTFTEPTIEYPHQGYWFGHSVDVSGDNILIGTPLDRTNLGGGQAHLFDAVSGDLVRSFDNPTSTYGHFGWSVAIDGDYVVIGVEDDATFGSSSGKAVVFEINQAPVATGDSYSLNANATLSVAAPGVLANDIDPENGSLSAVLGDDVQYGTLSLAADGSFSYQPNDEYFGSDSFTYQVSDGENLSNVVTVSLDVSALVATLDDPTVTTNDFFGHDHAIAADGNRILIGAWGDDTDAAGAGQAHLFDAASGSLLQTLSSPNPEEGRLFGRTVAIDGDRLLIYSLDSVSETKSGRIYLFDAVSGNVLQTFDNPREAPSSNVSFGLSIAIGGDYVVVGAPNVDSVGRAYIFNANTGSLLHTLDDPTPTASDYFGRSVSIDDGKVLVSAPGDDTVGTNVGQAHLFDAATGSLLHTFSGVIDEDREGFAEAVVAIKNNMVVIAAPYFEVAHPSTGEDMGVGQVRIFDATSGSLLRTIDNPSPVDGDGFGWALAIDGNQILIADPDDGTNGNDAGQSHLFDLTTGTLLQTFDDPTPHTMEYFGKSVALANNRAVIGNYWPGGDLTGQAYLFTTGPANQAPTQVALANTVTLMAEDTDTSSRVKVADIVITDDGHADGTNAISLTGADAASFEVDGAELYLAAGTALDYETQTSYSVTVSVEDSSVAGSTPVTVDFALAIDDVNEAPVATGESYSLNANSTLTVDAPGVLGNDTDPESEALTAVLVDDVQYGSLALSADGSFTYSPDNGYFGSDSFTYRADDGTNQSDAATVSFSVSNLIRTFDDPTLVAGDNHFGTAVAIDGNRMLVGASRDSTVADAAGQAHLYDFTTGTLLQTFDSPSATALDFFGAAVALEGDHVVVGAWGDDANGSAVGRVYVYSATTGNLVHTLDDPTPTTNDYFGQRLAMSGDLVIIGAPGDDTAGNNVGQAHLFSASTGQFIRTFDDPTVTTIDYFGYGVAIDGNSVLIGAPWDKTTGTVHGQAHLFDATSGDLIRTFDDPSDPSSMGSTFAEQLAIAGNHVLIGDQGHRSNVPDSGWRNTGEVYLFEADTGNLVHTLTEPTVDYPWSGFEFGSSLAIAGDNLLIGAAGDHTSGNLVGQAHLFDASTGNLLTSFNDPTPTSQDQFGFSVAIDAHNVLIGAPRDDTQGTEVGQAHVFTIGPNEAPSSVALTNIVASLPEDTDTSSQVKVGDIVITDDGEGTNTITLTGTDAASFTVVGTELFLTAGTALDYETKTSYDVTVSVEDSSVAGSVPVTVNHSLAISDVNEAPTGVALANTTTSLPEDTDTNVAVKIADIQVTDDALGSNAISLSGTDAASFSVVGTELFLAAGVALDYETKTSYDVTISVEDSSVSGSTPVTVNYTLAITDVNENPTTSVTILDDGEAGFAENGFTEQSNAQVAAAYDGDVHHMQGGTGEASWTFTGLPADRYQVAATWAYKYNNNYNATDAPFTLSDGAGGVFSTQIVNQKLTPGEFEDAGVMWDTLDTVEVSGGTLVVTLGAGSASNKYVVADAIRVSVAATLTLSINDASVAESAGTAATTATVTRNGPTDYPVDVDLLVSDATEISVPATVTIPAGQASVAFSIDAVDDVFFDGTQSVNVLATAIGYSDGSDSLEILDDETAHTALIDDGEAGFAQSGFTYQNNAQVAAAYNGDNYNLRNGDDSDQASWTFTGLDDGAYHVMATWAHKYNNNYNATDAPFQILDAGSNVLSSVAINQKNAPSQHDVGGTFWDTLDTVYVAGGELTVTVGATAQANKFVVADAVRIEQLVQPSSTLVVQLGEEIVSENAGSVMGIVSRGAETVGDLIVTLNSDATASGTVPATVTIPDGVGAVPFTLTVVDDAVVDGDQQVAVTATAVGYTGGTDSLLVEDDEFPPVQIIDNGDAGFTETGGFKERTWAEAYDGDNHYMRGSDGEARWHFTDLIDGEYTVSVTWDHISDNKYNATDAPFTIRNAADEQLLAAAVDQTLSPADFSDGVTDWHTLGTVYVIDGELTVSLTEALVNKYVVADAVRLEIDTNPTSKLLVILDASSVSEAGTLNGKVIRTGDPAGSLTVNLASDNAAAATVPATITLGEGARYGTFAITPTDDSAPDGTQVAGISATATGFTAGTAALDVTDDDATILFVDNGEDGFVADAGFKRRNVAGAYQNDNHSMRGGTGEASWTFTGLEEGQYFVSATWNHIYENRYNTEKAPFSITNGSGNLLATTIVDQTQTPADFTDGGYGWEALAPVYINDGTLIVTLGASSTNHHAVADAIRIELNESLAPSLFVLVDTLSESAGASTGTVVRTGDVSSEATVGLTSSNPDAATVESSITFAIGESTKSFAVTPTDDSSPDGIQQSTIEATAASYAAGTAVLNVQDDDALEVAIMDNTDNGYTSNGFRYNANKQVSQAYGGNNESLKGGEPGEEASWTFTGLADGVYHVSATWNHQYNNNYNATDAQYSITNAGDEALATTTINQSNAPSEFLDNGIAWGTLETVTVTGGELIVTVSGGSNPNRHTVADAVRIARVAQLGGSSMRMAEVDPFYDPLEDSLDDLASEWSGASEEEDRLVWGE